MTSFCENDGILSVKEIEELIQEKDVKGVFATRHRWRANFVKYFQKMIAVKQIVTFRRDGELVGLCSWLMVDDDRKLQINKTTWRIPDNVVEGNIIYVGVCILSEGASIFKVKKFLERRVKPMADQVVWNDMYHGRFFKATLKGGVPCQIAG